MKWPFVLESCPVLCSLLFQSVAFASHPLPNHNDLLELYELLLCSSFPWDGNPAGTSSGMTWTHVEDVLEVG